MKKENNEEDVQRRYMELQLLGKQIKAVQQQIEAMDEQLGSIAIMIDALDELKGTKEGSEMLSPIGEGIFVKGKLADSNEIIVNAGAGVAVTKSVEDTKELLRGKLEQGHKHRQEMMEDLEKMVEQAKGAEKQLAEMIE